LHKLENHSPAALNCEKKKMQQRASMFSMALVTRKYEQQNWETVFFYLTWFR